MPSSLARILGALVYLLVLLPGPAAAHAGLVEAYPEDGERLDQSPTELVLRFNEPVVPVTVRLLDSRGAEISGVTVERRGETLIVRPSVPLPEGAYLLSYRVTSVDSHPVGASLRFGVGVAPMPEQGDAAADWTTRWLGLLVRWLVYVTALGAAGLALGLGVLAVTASFPLDPPPRATTAAAKGVTTDGVTIATFARDRQAALTLVPGRPGANRLEAWVTDASGAPVAAKEATIQVALPEAGIEPARSPAAMSRPGVYVADGLALPYAGRWRLRLDLLVDDFTKLTFEGEVTVGGKHDHGGGDHHHTGETN